MKRLTAILSICVLLLPCIACFADSTAAQERLTIVMQIGNPVMIVNDIQTEIDPGRGTSPVIVNNRTLLPIRFLIESVGGAVNWSEPEQEVTVTLGEDQIQLVIGSTTADLNGDKRTLDTAPVVINGRTMLPVRFIAESFGFEVAWNEKEQRITISKELHRVLPEEFRDTVPVSDQETRLENGLSAVRYTGNSLFDSFLEQGGAASDAELVHFLQKNIVQGAGQLSFLSDQFGCSTISGQNDRGERIFGRNFDWYTCNALILLANPVNAYASISTVNTDFIQNAFGSFQSLPENIRTVVSMYAPLDGMNETGLCAAVLYIEDAAAINQNTGKPDITTTTAIRLILDQASTVDEALTLLRQYDMHNALGMMIHFAIADASGRSVAVEYIGNEMIVTESPVVTNFYLADGDKHGVGSSQSHTRFTTLTNALMQNQTMEMSEVRDALESVSKHHFNDGETTEWSIVYNQSQRIAQYYHRENFDQVYTFKIH